MPELDRVSKIHTPSHKQRALEMDDKAHLEEEWVTDATTHASTELCAHVHFHRGFVIKRLRSAPAVNFALRDSVPTWRTDKWVPFRSSAQDKGTVMLCLSGTLVNVASAI